MSVVAAILAELCSRGVVVRADGETFGLKPKAALDDSLLARVQANKGDILAVLSGRPATCSPTCYEIEPGKWIHHPWDGCKTPVPSREPYVPSRADCGCDGPVCSRCFLCPKHCHCRIQNVGPEAAAVSDLGRDAVPKSLAHGRSQPTDFVGQPTSDYEARKSSDSGGPDSKHV